MLLETFPQDINPEISERVRFYNGGKLTSERKRKIPIHTVNIKDADGYALTYQQAIKRELDKLKLYGDQFIYSAFHRSLLKAVLETGTYRFNTKDPDIIFGCITNLPNVAEPGIRDDYEKDIFFYLDHLLDQKDQEHPTYGLIAVFDRSQCTTGIERLIQGEEIEISHPVYVFKDPKRKLDALLAVIKVIDR